MTFSTDKDSRKIPEIDKLEKGKKVVPDSAVFQWKSDTDSSVALVENGSKLETDSIIYLISCSWWKWN